MPSHFCVSKCGLGQLGPEERHLNRIPFKMGIFAKKGSVNMD